MIKANDFAAERGVTYRQMMRLIQRHEKELEGLFERKGANGTWLSDEACNILMGYMKHAPAVVVDNELQRQIDELTAANDVLKDKIIALHEEHSAVVLQLAEAQGAQKQLEASESERKELADKLTARDEENAQLRIELEKLKSRGLIARIINKF